VPPKPEPTGGGCQDGAGAGSAAGAGAGARTGAGFLGAALRFEADFFFATFFFAADLTDFFLVRAGADFRFADFLFVVRFFAFLFFAMIVLRTLPKIEIPRD
jgi:hypothetical protein